MTKQEKQIEGQLRTNYQNALKLVPPKLRNEFEGTIMPLEIFLSFASPLSLTKKIDPEVIPLFLQEYIRARFSINRFGRRMILARVDPTLVYAELVRNLWS